MIKEYSFWRLPLGLVCLIVGHRKANIRPLVPNPYATESWIVGCARCSRSLP